MNSCVKVGNRIPSSCKLSDCFFSIWWYVLSFFFFVGFCCFCCVCPECCGHRFCPIKSTIPFMLKVHIRLCDVCSSHYITSLAVVFLSAFINRIGNFLLFRIHLSLSVCLSCSRQLVTLPTGNVPSNYKMFEKIQKYI